MKDVSHRSSQFKGRVYSDHSGRELYAPLGVIVSAFVFEISE